MLSLAAQPIAHGDAVGATVQIKRCDDRRGRSRRAYHEPSAAHGTRIVPSIRNVDMQCRQLPRPRVSAPCTAQRAMGHEWRSWQHAQVEWRASKGDASLRDVEAVLARGKGDVGELWDEREATSRAGRHATRRPAGCTRVRDAGWLRVGGSFPVARLANRVAIAARARAGHVPEAQDTSLRILQLQLELFGCGALVLMKRVAILVAHPDLEVGHAAGDCFAQPNAGWYACRRVEACRLDGACEGRACHRIEHAVDVRR